jgi:hypothetical protein
MYTVSVVTLVNLTQFQLHPTRNPPTHVPPAMQISADLIMVILSLSQTPIIILNLHLPISLLIYYYYLYFLTVCLQLSTPICQ